MNEEHVYFFKALAHRSRLYLLELLSENDEMSVTELTAAVPREGSTISRHLAQLYLHGLVNVRQDGQNRFYSLNPSGILDTLEGFIQDLRLAGEITT